jgi:branched-chain amino acid transport system permease protein
MYGLIALGFHVTYVVSNTVNFSQGSSMMLGAVLGYTFATRLGWPLPLAFVASLLLCAMFGLLVERTLVRPFVVRGSNAWLMATVAGGIVLDNVVLFTFGREPRSFPPMLSTSPIRLFGTGVFPLQLIIPVMGLGVAAALAVLLRHTRHGKALLAVVQNPDAARLMGINVKVAIAAAFALSTALAGLAGLLIAPLFSVHSDMGTLFGIKAFAVAILGGIGSAPGVMLAGLIYGVSEAMITALFGSSYTQIAMFTAVIGALALMPQGLLGRAAIKKV